MAGGFGFAAPLTYLQPPSAQAMDDPAVAASAANAQKTGGSLSGDINAGKSLLHSMGLGNPPATQYINSPMLPSTPGIEDMSGAVGDAASNVAAAGPGAFAGDAGASELGDAAASSAPDIASMLAELFL